MGKGNRRRVFRSKTRLCKGRVQKGPHPFGTICETWAAAAQAFDHVGYETAISAWNGICFGAHYAHAGAAWAWGVRADPLSGRAIVPPSFVAACSLLALVPAAAAPLCLRNLGYGAISGTRAYLATTARALSPNLAEGVATRSAAASFGNFEL